MATAAAADTRPMSTIPQRELDALLRDLQAEERALSLQRRRLHDRMALFPDPSPDLQARERELSDRRRALHRQIDELRAQRLAPDEPA